MTPYRKPGGRTYYLTLPLRTGGYARPTSGTRDFDTAQAMQAMLTLFAHRGKRHWEFVDAIASLRMSVAEVYDYYVGDRLDELRALLADVDLAPAIDAWEERIRRELRPETARKYSAEVASIFPVRDSTSSDRGENRNRLPVMRSTITRAWLKTKLAQVAGSNTNRRRYGAAWLSVLDDVVEAGLLERNPMREIALPPSNPSKVPHLPHAAVLQLLELMPDGVHRALAAFRHGAGVEMQAALQTHRRDIVDVDERIVWAHGSKNTHRDRQVRLEPVEWAVFHRYVRAGGFLPDARLFPVTIKEHRKVERDALDALAAKGVLIPSGYTLHACRHSYAVEMMRQGRDPVLIANNLGHANTQLVLALYGKFQPSITDIVRAAKRGAK